MQQDDTAIQLAQDRAVAEEPPEIPNLTAADDKKATQSVYLRKLPMQDPPDVSESELLVAVKSTSKSKLRELIPDEVELFQRNKLENVADKESVGFSEPKITKSFKKQYVKSKAFQKLKRSIDHSRTAPSLEHGEGTSDPWTMTKSNKPNRKGLIANKSKTHKQYMTLNRKQASSSKQIDVEYSETEDDKSSSAVQQESYLRKQKIALSPTLSDDDDTFDKPLRSRKDKGKKKSKKNKKNLVANVGTSYPKTAERVDIDDFVSEPKQQMRQSSATKLQEKIEPASSSDLSNTIQPCKRKKSKKNKLIFSNKTVQVNLMHNESSSNLESNIPKAIKKQRESSAFEFQRGVETTSPHLNEEALNNRKSEKSKLLPFKSKNQTKKKTPMLSKKYAGSSREADYSDFEDESDSAKNLNKTSKITHSPELGHGTPEPRPRKRKRTNRMKLYQNLSKRNKLKRVARENIAKARKDKSSDTSEFEYQEKKDSLLAELSEETPEPIHPKRKRPLRMTLLPTVPKKNKRKKLLKEKVETSELDESEIDIIMKEMQSLRKLTTPEPRNDSELSQSLDLSEGTPEPIKPSTRNRSPRIKPIPAYGRPATMKLPFIKGRRNKMKLIHSQNSPTQLRTNSNSPPSEPISAKAQTRTAKASSHILAPKARLPIKSDSPAVCSKTVPRSRVLVTPERKEKISNSKKKLRTLADKRKWIRINRQKIQLQSHYRQAETISSSGETSSDSGNIDCSGPGDYDNNLNKGKKYKKGNNEIGGGSVKGDNGGSGSMDDTSQNKGGKAGYSGSSSGEIRGILGSDRISGVSCIAGGGVCDSSMISIPGCSGLSGYTGGLRGIDDHGISGLCDGGGPMGYTTSLSGMMGYSGMPGSGRISGSADASSMFGNAGMIGMGGMGSGTINSLGYSSALSSMGMSTMYGAAMSGMGYGGNYSNTISGMVDGHGISNIAYADMGDIDFMSSMGDNADTSGMGDNANTSGMGDNADTSGMGDNADTSGMGDNANTSGTGDNADTSGMGNNGDTSGMDASATTRNMYREFGPGPFF